MTLEPFIVAFIIANVLLMMTICASRPASRGIRGGAIGEPDHEVIVEPREEPIPKTAPAPPTEPVREPEPLTPAQVGSVQH